MQSTRKLLGCTHRPELSRFVSVVGLALATACKTSTPAPSTTGTPPATASASANTPLSPSASAANVIPAMDVQAAVNPNHLPVYTGAFGSLEGTVTVVGPSSPAVPGDFTACPQAKAVHGVLFREEVGADHKRLLADAVVGVTGYAGYYVPEQHIAVQIEAHDCVLSTRTVAMTFGQRLEVKNTDTGVSPTYYAFDLATSKGSALLVAAPNSDPIRLYPRQPGGDKLVEKMGRPHMTADVLVATSPQHAVTDVRGHFRIDGIPVGKLDALVTHTAAGMKGQGKPVEIKANAITTIELVMTYAPSAQPSAATSGSAKAPKSALSTAPSTAPKPL